MHEISSYNGKYCIISIMKDSVINSKWTVFVNYCL